MSREPLCSVCFDATATKLCDWVLGWPAVAAKDSRGNPFWVRSLDSVPFTCDAPLCDDCAKVVGHIHFSGKGGGNDTTDRCPHHADAENCHVFLTDAEAERARAEAHIRPLPDPAIRGLAPYTTTALEAEVRRRKQEAT